MASMFYPLVLSCMVIGLVKRQVICRDGSVCWAILQAKHGLKTPKHCHILAICKLAQIILLSHTSFSFDASVTPVLLIAHPNPNLITIVGKPTVFPLRFLAAIILLSYHSLSNQMAARKAMATAVARAARRVARVENRTSPVEKHRVNFKPCGKRKRTARRAADADTPRRIEVHLRWVGQYGRAT